MTPLQLLAAFLNKPTWIMAFMLIVMLVIGPPAYIAIKFTDSMITYLPLIKEELTNTRVAMTKLESEQNDKLADVKVQVDENGRMLRQMED